MAKLTLDEALTLANDLIVEGQDGHKYIRVDKLRAIEDVRREEAQVEMKTPQPKTFAQAKAAAAQDEEVKAEFAGRPPDLGRSPTAARA